MKTKFTSSLLVMLSILFYSYAQEVTTITTTSDEISDNLDLEAVASIFGNSKDLEDFEDKLNDPDTQISNLDLNEDGYVDYLRVIETSEDNTHLVTLQAVIGDNLYQDVATIEVEKDGKEITYVQVVGDTYIYGPEYIIEPVYVAPPIIFTWFWGPLYRPWTSPYYFHHYPPHFSPWAPMPPHRYQNNIHIHIDSHNTYRHTTVRRSSHAANMHQKSRRNDYGKQHPDKSFQKRNDGVKNKEALKSGSRNTKANSNTRNSTTNQNNRTSNSSTNKKVDDKRKTQSTNNSSTRESNNRQSNQQTRNSNSSSQNTNNKSVERSKNNNKRSSVNSSSSRNKSTTRRSKSTRSNRSGNRSSRSSSRNRSTRSSRR